MKDITAVSLFSGAGGMDVGFENAGVNVVVANEINKAAAATYIANRPDCNMIIGDINNVLDKYSNYTGTELVFGGPPCQGFSVAGKMNPNDERSKLIWSYLDVVERVQPKAFVMENVKALACLEKWKPVRQAYMERASQMGYFCSYVVLNSADFGVPQKRERVFFIGRKKNVDFSVFLSNLEKYKANPPTIREILTSLPRIGTKGNECTCTAKITLASNPIMRKSPYAGMLFNGMGRPLNLDAVSTTLPASMGGNKTPIVDEALLRNPDGPDWVKEYHSKLRNNEITAEFGAAPSNLRRLSIVEAAAIQTFPPQYIFEGNKSAIYTQIGNAVPCKLAECVAKAVIETYLQ